MTVSNGNAGHPASVPHPSESPGLDRGFCRWVVDDPLAFIYLRPLPWAVSPGGFDALDGFTPDPNPDFDPEHDPGGAARGAPGPALLAGGPVRFSHVEVIVRSADRGRPHRAVGSIEAVTDWAAALGREAEIESRFAQLSAPRPPVAGLTLDRPRIMGVVNVTPDSFSDGGDFNDRQRAIDQGRALIDAGCDILDIGGESTRPGALPVPANEEIDRVLPVIEALAAAGVPISIDTRHAAVMRAALQAGARIINDVTALSGDPESPATVAAAGDVPVVLMHMLGEPQTMQNDPRYDCAPLDVADRLGAFAQHAIDAGIGTDQLIVDPGIGFGKTVAHNVDLLRHTAMLHMYGFPVMIGLSRKRFLGSIGGESASPKARLPGSLAAGLFALQQGAQILRVHDGLETVQAVRLLQALR